jgi:hypothetical protein
LQLETIVPVLMGCALLWVGRDLGWTARFAVATLTVALIMGVLLFARLI